MNELLRNLLKEENGYLVDVCGYLITVFRVQAKKKV